MAPVAPGPSAESSRLAEKLAAAEARETATREELPATPEPAVESGRLAEKLAAAEARESATGEDAPAAPRTDLASEPATEPDAPDAPDQPEDAMDDGEAGDAEDGPLTERPERGSFYRRRSGRLPRLEDAGKGAMAAAAAMRRTSRDE